MLLNIYTYIFNKIVFLKNAREPKVIEKKEICAYAKNLKYGFHNP